MLLISSIDDFVPLLGDFDDLSSRDFAVSL